MSLRLLERRGFLPFAAAALGLACGGVLVLQPSAAVALGLAIAVVLALTALGRRSFAWAIVLVAVAPWYPFLSENAVPPVLPQVIFCVVIAAAPVVPWLWVAAGHHARRPPSRLALLYGLGFPLLALSINQTLGAVKPMIEAPTFGLLFGGVAFLCARRFDTRAWPPAAFAGLVALIAMGLLAYAAAPSERVGSFSGYPITYGALVVGLLPSGLLFALRRSTALAAVTAAAACGLLILSQSRSSWIAVIVLLLAVVVLLMRQRRWRELRIVGGLAALATGMVLATGSLNGIVERKLSSDARQTDSVTHRVYSYGYAMEQIGQRPVFGAGAPGYAAAQAADETDIGALDNGYLSIAVDVGAVGLLVVLVPILLALGLLWRWGLHGATPAPEEASLVLGILGIAVVTAFYDSFYWAQLSLLLFAMGGTLSSRWQHQLRRVRQRRPAKTKRLALSPGSL